MSLGVGRPRTTVAQRQRFRVLLVFFCWGNTLHPLKADADEAASNVCNNRVIEHAISDSPDTAIQAKRRLERLEHALSCEDLPPIIRAHAALELLFHANSDDTPPLARTTAMIHYLKQADQDFWRAGEIDTWRIVRLSLIDSLQDLASYRANPTILIEASQLLDELLERDPGSAGRFDVLYATVWLESDRRIARIQGAWGNALTAIQRALALQPTDEMANRRADLVAQKAALLGMGPLDRPPSDTEINEAIDAHRSAIEQYGAIGDERAARRERVNLATGLMRRPGHETIEEAIAILDVVTTEDGSDFVGQGVAWTALGNAYFQRGIGDNQENAETAIRAYRKAIERLPVNAFAETLNARLNLALALSLSVIDREARLDEALGLVQSVSDLPQTDADRARTGQLLVSVLVERTRFGMTSLVDVQEALEKARSLQELLSLKNRLGLAGNIAEYERMRAIDDQTLPIDQVADAYQAAIALAVRTDNRRIWAALQNNLGNFYQDREDKQLVDRARAAYQAALTVRTPELLPSEYVDTMTNLANLAFDQRDWNAAAEAFTTVLRDHLTHFQTLDETVRSTVIGLTKRRFEHAAYSLAKTGKIDDALAVLELGRARAMKTRLGNGLNTRDLVTALSWRPGAPPEDVFLIAPVVTPQGTAVFGIAGRDGDAEVDVLFLESLNGNEVGLHIGSDSGWLSRYANAMNLDESASGLGKHVAATMPAAIGHVTNWLGSALVQPVASWAQERFKFDQGTLVFSVQGELAILPIHAASLADGTPLLSRYSVAYTPAVGLLQNEVATEVPMQLSVVANPSADAHLPVSVLEAQMIAQNWPGTVELLPPAAVDRDTFVRAMATPGLLHFVGHGHYDPNNPLESYLVLSGGQQISVRELHSATGGAQPDLVVLSACETGIVGLEAASNEYEGLAGAFLSLGVQGVVASLWPVNEYPTMLIMRRFYQRLSEQVSPVHALREAQLWLANATGSELLNLIDHDYMAIAYNNRVALRAMINFRSHLSNQRDLKPFKDPYYWAGLFFTGVVI